MATQVLTDPTTGVVVPDFLKGVKGISAKRSKPTLNQSKVVLVSQPKVGKSALIYTNPKAIVLDPENSASHLTEDDEVKAIRVGPVRDEKTGQMYSPTIADYRAVADKLIEAKRAGKCPIEMVAIDTMDFWLDLHGRELASSQNVIDVSEYRGAGEGGGYKIRNAFLFKLLDDLYDAGFGWCAIIHMEMKTVRVGGVETVTEGIALPRTPLQALWERCEHMLGIEIQTVEKKESRKLPNGNEYEAVVGTEKKRVITAQANGLFATAGSRIQWPAKIAVSKTNGWADLEAAYTTAVSGEGGK